MEYQTGEFLNAKIKAFLMATEAKWAMGTLQYCN